MNIGADTSMILDTSHKTMTATPGTDCMPVLASHLICSLVAIIVACGSATTLADDPQPNEPPKSTTNNRRPAVKAGGFHENFEESDPSRFTTKIPNEYTEVCDGVLWTHGQPEGAYPPIVELPIRGHDLEISFRYRQLGDGEWLWFLVDGDDGFGSVDHMLRVKLLRKEIQLQVDAHSLDGDHPLRQKWNRGADPVSGAYRLNELLPPEPVDLSRGEWHEVTVVIQGKTAHVSVDGDMWHAVLERPCFNAAKHKLLWLLKGGEEGIEIDDIVVRPLNAKTPDGSI